MNIDQLKTILWLRWRLTRNQWARSGGLGALLAGLIAVLVCVLGGAGFAAGILGGAMGLGAAKPIAVMAVWVAVTLAFLFFWLIGLLAELQRSETIDLQRMMHLPVALGQMFVINYVASHLVLSIVLWLPAMTGLALGLVISRGAAMILLLPLAWSMVFMITAWTYCLRGWLAAMMTNPRRRRTVIMSITLGFILVAQLPNLYFSVLRSDKVAPKPTATKTPDAVKRQRDSQQAARQERLKEIIGLQKFIPPLWLPVGAQALAENRPLPAVLGALGCASVGVLGLRRAYRSTLRFHHGDTGAKAAAAVPATPTARTGRVAPRGRSGLMELRLPFVPEAAAAVALGSFRSMLRAPEVKMTWATSFLVTGIVGASIFMRAAPKLPEIAKPFVVLATVAFSLFMLIQFLTNLFGFDRQGFRALVLSPVDRRLLLFGKNLASWPVGLTFGVVLLGVTSVWLRLPPLAAAAAFLQLVALLLICSLGGNLLSILVPYRVAPGSTKPTKTPAKVVFLMVFSQMLFPLVMIPVFLPPFIELLWVMGGWPAAVPVNFLLSVLLAAVVVLLYWKLLYPLGDLLRRREIEILNTVTAEVE